MIEDNVEVRLILADNTVLNNSECGYSNKRLWCFLRDISFSDAFQYFYGPDSFSMITFDMGFSDDFYDRIIYSGFTDVTAVRKEENYITVQLEGPEIKIERERIYKDPDKAPKPKVEI